MNKLSVRNICISSKRGKCYILGVLMILTNAESNKGPDPGKGPSVLRLMKGVMNEYTQHKDYLCVFIKKGENVIF